MAEMAHRILDAIRALRGMTVAQRRELTPKRASENVKFEHAGHRWFATYSRFPDGQLAEVFLSTAKTGELLRHMAADSAIAASLALQYGCPTERLISALARDTGGEPATCLAAALDLIERKPK